MKISEELWNAACYFSVGRYNYRNKFLHTGRDWGACDVLSDEAAEYFTLLFIPSFLQRRKHGHSSLYWMGRTGELECNDGDEHDISARKRRFLALLIAYECAKGENL